MSSSNVLGEADLVDRPDVAIDAEWHHACWITDLSEGRGVAVLIEDVAIAVFCVPGGDVCAVDHVDPFTSTPTIARGMIGSVGLGAGVEEMFVAAPLYKQRFSLSTGQCLDDDEMCLRVWPTMISEGRILIRTVA